MYSETFSLSAFNTLRFISLTFCCSVFKVHFVATVIGATFILYQLTIFLSTAFPDTLSSLLSHLKIATLTIITFLRDRVINYFQSFHRRSTLKSATLTNIPSNSNDCNLYSKKCSVWSEPLKGVFLFFTNNKNEGHSCSLILSIRPIVAYN